MISPFRDIFVAHCVSTSKELAGEFQRLARKHRPDGTDMPNVFLSSDPFSIPSGKRSLDEVLGHLDTCTDFVALITDVKDWRNRSISFETGYFMGRQKARAKYAPREEGNRKRPLIFVFGDRIRRRASWPFDEHQLIDTRDSSRVQDALLSLGIRPCDEECMNDFTALFRMDKCNSISGS